jgi:proteic killer suppression protein
VIVSFRNRGTEDIFLGVDSKPARRTCQAPIWPVARRKLALLDAAQGLDDLAFPAGNELHRLVRDRWGQHAIRINDQYRVCFRWTDAGAEDVEITDYH